MGGLGDRLPSGTTARHLTPTAMPRPRLDHLNPASTGPERTTQSANRAVKLKRIRAAIPARCTSSKRNEKPAPRGRGGWEEGRFRHLEGTSCRRAIYCGSVIAANNRAARGERRWSRLHRVVNLQRVPRVPAPGTSSLPAPYLRLANPLVRFPCQASKAVVPMRTTTSSVRRYERTIYCSIGDEGFAILTKRRMGM